MEFKIGFIGLGTMGKSMCENIIKGGYPVWLYDINREQVDNLAKIGRTPCNNLQEIGENCNIIIVFNVYNSKIN